MMLEYCNIMRKRIAPNLTLLTSGGLLHVRTIACSTMYRDARATVVNLSALFLLVLTDKNMILDKSEGIFSKVHTLVCRPFFVV